MKIKRLSKTILIIIFFAGLLGFSLYLLNYPGHNLDQAKSIVASLDESFGWKFPVAKFPSTGSKQLAYSDIRDPGGIAQGLPMRLKIPTIGVDSAIEDAYITTDGRMDVPAGSINVAWFALGPNPGDLGSAVIGGHYGIRNGVPFVFYNLDKLKVGDKVYVENDKNDTLTFIIRAIQLFDRNADATAVFTSDDNLAHLNIITCEGIWNKVNDSYPLRRVLFTDLVSPDSTAIDTAIVSQAPKPDTSTDTTIFSRTLSIGMRGADVVALQTILEQKGFLRIPIGVTKGYFGTLTQAAVAKYQTSVALPANGIFGSSSIAKLNQKQAATVVKPILPLTSTIDTSTTPVSQADVQLVKNLSPKPLDWLITILLFVAIIFMIYKVTRR